jgi:pilus assembly protein CpaC
MSTRRVSTVVEMREGQTMAIGGLLSHRTTVQVQRFPLLGDVPYVGPLFFSAKTMTQEENELLILITPEIVRPMDAHEVPPPPGFDVTKPSHDEFWKYNMTEGRPDTGYYQSAPYGSNTSGVNVDYQHFNPNPAGSMYSPMPTNPGPGPGRIYNPTPNGMQGAPGAPPMQGPYGPGAPAGMPMNGAPQYRPAMPMPQASNQRQQGQRPNRNNMQSQVIRTGTPELKQTNYSAPLGMQRNRQPVRQVNSGYSQDQ